MTIPSVVLWNDHCWFGWQLLSILQQLCPEGQKLLRGILTTYCPPETHDACGRRPPTGSKWVWPLLSFHSGHCADTPSALLFAQHVTIHLLFLKKSSKTDCWLCCLLFSVGTSFLVVTGWNEFCGRFEIFGGWIITQGTGWVSGEAEASSAKARWWKVFSLLLKCKFDLYKWTCALFLLEHSVS